MLIFSSWPCFFRSIRLMHSNLRNSFVDLSLLYLKGIPIHPDFCDIFEKKDGKDGIMQCEQKFVKKKYLTHILLCAILPKVIKMEAKLKQAYLYDFYGELLNSHQRKVYEDFYFNDLSLGEIAEEEGISRQGVHDLVKRSSRALEGYEQKLHLVDKFLYIRDKVGEIQRLARSYDQKNQQEIKTEIEKISNEILEGL